MDEMHTNIIRVSKRCAWLSVLIPIAVGFVFLVFANDGSIPSDWFKDSYYRKLVFGSALGIAGYVGLICIVFNVCGVLALAINRVKKLKYYLYHLVNPVLAFPLINLADWIQKDLP